MLKSLTFLFAAFLSIAGLSAPAAAHGPSTVVKTGSFTGLSNHITTGNVSIVRTNDGYVAILEGNFELDGAPAPTLGFGKNGFDKKTEFTKLNSKKGLQVYAIPASINPADFDEFYVWCADFNVGLGIAKLK